MGLNDFDHFLSAARAVQQQAMENPDVGIPVDPDVADFMGAIYDPALDEEDRDESLSNHAIILVRETGELHSLAIEIADGSTLRDRNMLMFSLPHEFDTTLKAYTCNQSTYEDLCVDVDEHNKDVEKKNRKYAESKARSKEIERQKAEKLGMISIPTKDRKLQQATVETRLRTQVQDSAPAHETTKKQVQPLAKSHGMER